MTTKAPGGGHATVRLAGLGEVSARPAPHVQVALLVYHRDGAELVPLPEGASVVVGRQPPSDVVVPDVSLSRQHARFTNERGEITVEDLGSSNGTRRRGETVERTVVLPGDELSLGSVLVAVQATESAARKGLVAYDRLCDQLEAEIVRSHFFGRTLSVLMLRGARDGSGAAPHFPAFHARVQAALRPIDRLGLYSSEALLAFLPELDADAAMALARTLTSPADAHLLVGVATYPESGTSAGELVAACREAAQAATPASPCALARARAARTIPPASADDDGVIAESPAMKAALTTARRVARGTIPVLVLGETGSGKEVIARLIHDASSRRDKPLVSVNCGAIAASLLESILFGHEKGSFTGALQTQKGVFESADGGTVLLDEVGELPAPAQAALLRVLEAKRVVRVGSTKEIAVDVRVIAATHRDLEAMCADGRFREDLYYRLNTLTLRIPPLRERPEDVDALVARFLARASMEGGARTIDPDALELLRAHAWPGNVRELRNAIERAVVIAPGDTIGVDDLPERVRATSRTREAPIVSSGTPSVRPGAGAVTVSELSGDFRSRMEQLEAAVLNHALAEAGHNQSETARRLGMPLRTLVHKIRVHGIRRPPT